MIVIARLPGCGSLHRRDTENAEGRKESPFSVALRVLCTSAVSRVTSLIALVALLACVVAADLPTVSAVVPWIDCEGYTPVVITVSSSSERTLKLDASAGTASARIDLVVGGGQAVRTTVLLPPLSDGASQVQVAWSSDDGLDGSFSVSPANDHRRLGLAVIDHDERIPLKSLEFADKSTFATARYGSSTSTISARVPHADLPERWQGYPTWMTLVFAAADDLALAPEQRLAIATWASAGGVVVVVNSSQRDAWRTLGVEPLMLSAAEDALTERLNRLGTDNQNQITLVPVPGTESVPATGFMLLATLFALVVGPLNLWWVRRRGTPALFLLTTPVLSLITCVVLLGANIVIEGLSLRRVASQLTVLDQRHARAIAWTRATYYGGFSVARFDVDSEAEVRRYEPDQDTSGYRRGYQRETPEAHAIDWRGGQHLAGEWIPARRNRQLLYAVARSERAQLQLDRNGNGWRITNGLGVAVRRVVWHDGAGVIYTCGAIPIGASVDLTVEEEPAAIPIGGFGKAAEQAAAIATEPWGFGAELDGAFGIMPGPIGIDAVPLTSQVVGRLQPGQTPGATP